MRGSDMSRTPRVTVVCFTHVQRDARVLRQIRTLAQRYDVTVVGYGTLAAGAARPVHMCPVPAPTSFIRRNLRDVPKLVLGRVAPQTGYDRWYWDRRDRAQALAHVIESRPDVITANDWIALPLAAEAARRIGAKVVLDLHEYAPLQRDNRRAWMALVSPMVIHYLRRYASDVAASITVNETLAARYRAEYGLAPVVVMNAPELKAGPVFRPTPRDRIRLVHHGAAIPDRKIEVMIDAVAQAGERFTLDFYFTADNASYVRTLQARGHEVAPGRIAFHDAIAPDDILGALTAHDLGIHVLRPNSFNNASALPNKFFEFVCAGLAVCIGPTPEMAAIARRYGFAAITDGFDADAVARTLRGLQSSQVDRLKECSVAAAKELSAGHQMAKLLQVHEQALERVHGGVDGAR
jgi:hypothetical protein